MHGLNNELFYCLLYCFTALTICIPPLLGWKDPESRDNLQINGGSSSSTSGDVIVRLLGDNCSTALHGFRGINCTSGSGDTVNTSIGTKYPKLSGRYHHLPIDADDDSHTLENYSMNNISSDNLTPTSSSLGFNIFEDNSNDSKHFSTVGTNLSLPFREKSTELKPLCGPDFTTHFSLDGTLPSPTDPPTACALSRSPGYVIYSALGSFWIPMLVMVFFYVKIYQTAVKATDALRRGVVTQRSSSAADPSVNLRVHRGGGGGLQSRPYETVSRCSNGSVAASWLNGGEVLPPPHFRLNKLVQQISPRHCRPQSGDAMVTNGVQSNVRFYKRSLSHDCENGSRYANRNSLEFSRPPNEVTPEYYDCRGRTSKMDWPTSTFDAVSEEQFLSNGSSPPTSPIILKSNGTTSGSNVTLNNCRGLVHVRTQLRRLNREKKVCLQ